ncbi:MAG: alpha/beta hydrolase [Planctomycetota bacterium]|nr:alpha/beta hydrolase [Planctomycetota bacterium]
MTESPGYFASADGTPLYGVLHRPDAAGKTPVVLAPSLFEERKSAYAALAGMARALASNGHPVLRFDYRGSGESGGDPGVRRWADLAGDLAAAVALLKKESGGASVAPLGLRLGATLCLQEAARLDAKAVVALAPIVKGSAQARLWRLRTKIRAEMTDGGEAAASVGSPAVQTGGVLDFDGFAVAQAFFDDVGALDLNAAGALAVPSLLVQISHRAEPAPESERLAKALGGSCELQALRLEPFWDRIEHVDASALEALVTGFLARI